MLLKSLVLLGCLTFFSGCNRYYLSLCQQKVNRDYLASTAVQTPDPRQANPPIGQMVTMYWHIPNTILRQNPYVKLHVIYWDYTEGEFCYPISSRIGYANYSLLNDPFYAKKGLLTYSAEIMTEGGEIYKEWKHQLWVKLIHVND